MIDILAGFSLLGAAARSENPLQLISDTEMLYRFYKAGKPGFATMPPSQVKTIIQASARVSAVANTLAEDPNQLKNIADLLASL